jgi:hypothetical protein
MSSWCRPVNVRVGPVDAIPSKSNGAKILRTQAPTAPERRVKATTSSTASWVMSSAAAFEAMISTPSPARSLVTEVVIPIGVGIDHGCDRVTVGDDGDARVHVGGAGKIEQGVDQHRGARTGHQAGIAPSPPAVWLQPCVAANAQVMQTFSILRVVIELVIAQPFC